MDKITIAAVTRRFRHELGDYLLNSAGVEPDEIGEFVERDGPGF